MAQQCVGGKSKGKVKNSSFSSADTLGQLDSIRNTVCNTRRSERIFIDRNSPN